VTKFAKVFPRNDVREVRGASLLKTLNRVFPLGRKYYPLVRVLNNPRGLLATSFDKYRVLQPACWTKAVTKSLLFGTEIVPEFQLVKSLGQEVSHGFFVDLGANIGLYVLLFRSISNLPIIAFEPQPLLAKLLQWNIAFNELPDIDIRNAACGRERGEVPFWLGLNGSVIPPKGASQPKEPVAPGDADWEQQAHLALAGGHVIKVPMRVLDEELAEISDVGVLKMDCEGFEYDILKGARHVLKRHHPRLFVELHPETLQKFGHSTQEVVELLGRDYDMDFWYFQVGRARSKLAHSIAKFRRPKAHRCADAAEMLDAVSKTPGPNQVQLIGHPKRPM
jgi:FkbM family methyltransferase